MMEFQKLIEVRRSVRKYAADKKVTKEELMEMIGAAQEAPSWKNTETGRYYCVLSEEMTERVRRECLPEGNARKAENAVLVVTTFVKDTPHPPGPGRSDTAPAHPPYGRSPAG